MKTYKKIIESPRLIIGYDINTDSPRTYYDCLGYFLTNEINHISPDGNRLRNANDYQPTFHLQEIMERTAGDATNTENHIKLITEAFNAESDEKILVVYPVYKYEHSNISYKLGAKDGFDYSNCGFYIVTDKTAEKVGIKAKDYKKIIAQELSDYSAWANGEVYQYKLFDAQGQFIDIGLDCYSLDEIKENLGEEWANENMEDYME